MSGDPWAVRSDWPTELRECSMLAKPFTLEALGQAVAAALAVAEAPSRRKRNGG